MHPMSWLSLRHVLLRVRYLIQCDSNWVTIRCLEFDRIAVELPKNAAMIEKRSIGLGCRDSHPSPCVSSEIIGGAEWSIDARGGDLQSVGALDRIEFVELVAQFPAHLLAVLDSDALHSGTFDIQANDPM